MTARELTAALGGRWHGKYGTARCPAHDDRSPSLTVRDGESAPLLSCKAGCPRENVIAALKARRLWGQREPARPVSWQPPASKAENSGYVERIWGQTRPAPGTLVDLYLRDRCITWAIHPAIRFHPLLPYHHDGRVIGAWPAMVVRLDDPQGNLVGVHRTWLDHRIDANRTTKARLPDKLPPRKTLGRQGVAWFGRRDVAAIIVGEGIESALSASEYGDESWPSWGLTPVAAISASGLAGFFIPPTVRRLFIAEDADDAGRAATRKLVARAQAAGVNVSILRVEPIGEVA